MLDTLIHWMRPGTPPDGARWLVRAVVGLGDSFQAVLRPDSAAAVPDRSSILLHGIGVGAQRAGQPVAKVLQAFAGFAAASPLLAFHAACDRAMIGRARRAAALAPRPHRWLGIAARAAVLHPQVQAKSLDEWMAHFGIRGVARHQSAADTLATTELLLRLWPVLSVQRVAPTFAALSSLAAQQRWVQG